MIGFTVTNAKTLHNLNLTIPPDTSFSDEMSDLGSDASRGPTEPAVKRERIEMSHPLQEM